MSIHFGINILYLLDIIKHEANFMYWIAPIIQGTTMPDIMAIPVSRA